jgi:hypothetical protein
VLIIPYSWNENKQFIYSICKEIGMSKIKIILDYEVILKDKKNEINLIKGNILFIHLGRYKFEITLKEGKNNPKILKKKNSLDKSSEKTIPIKIPFKDDWQSSTFNHWIGNKKKGYIQEKRFTFHQKI